MNPQVQERSATLTQDDFRVQGASGAVLTAQMLTTLEGHGRVTVQHGTQQLTLSTDDLDALVALVATLDARARLYRQSVSSEHFN